MMSVLKLSKYYDIINITSESNNIFVRVIHTTNERRTNEGK